LTIEDLWYRFALSFLTKSIEFLKYSIENIQSVSYDMLSVKKAIRAYMQIKIQSETLIERKSRVPQIQGVQGRSRSKLLRALGNAEDGVSSAFPTCWVEAESEAQRVNKMEWFFDNLYFINTRVVNNLRVA
jgi:hypothetical protein